MATLDQLKQEATELGISFSANIGVDKLQGKIDEYYMSQETSGEEILELVVKKEQEEKSEDKSAVSGKKEDRAKRAKEAEIAANKTRVITIIDNDQRENNQTTVAIANCTNMYFDLGTVYIPLNVPVEVRQGHIDVLANVEIPMHIKDPKTGLYTYSVRKRYTIQYETV